MKCLVELRKEVVVQDLLFLSKQVVVESLFLFEILFSLSFLTHKVLFLNQTSDSTERGEKKSPLGNFTIEPNDTWLL